MTNSEIVANVKEAISSPGAERVILANCMNNPALIFECEAAETAEGGVRRGGVTEDGIKRYINVPL